MKRKYWLLALPMIALGLLFGHNQTVSASEFNFAVYPQFPAAQSSGNTSFYDLWLRPKAKQTLTMTLKNSTDQDVKLDVSIASATTNDNGVVEYGINKIKPDTSLKYNLKDYVTYAKQVTVPKKSSLAYHVQVAMPSTEFAGELAGGITFKQHANGDSGTKHKGVTVKNRFAYVLGLVMRNNNTLVQPKLSLHQVKATQVNYRNVILANLQNSKAVYINQVKADSVITKAGSSKAVYKHSVAQMQMAPNSNFNFTTPLNGKAFVAGKYHLKLTVLANKSTAGKSDGGKDLSGKDIKYANRWVFEKDFTITTAQAKKYNAKDVTIPKAKTNYLLIIGLIVLIVLLLLIILVMWLRSRRKTGKHHQR